MSTAAPLPLAQHRFNELVSQTLAHTLSESGFRRIGQSFHRRLGECVQAVSFHTAYGATNEQIEFYINVGLAFDSICRLCALPILERPKEHQCSVRGTRDRLEFLLERAPRAWEIGPDSNMDELAGLLISTLGELTHELDGMDGIAAFADHRWFMRERPKREIAQIHYLLKDYAAAWEEISLMTRLFAGKGNASDADWWLARFGLGGLKAKV